ncbi:MAG: GNAT family N-acetyltransferase [Bacteroidetes bacterium]|nr:GNAT family N-acetyltransferase [Bacteroidota bacterium]
MISLAPFTEVDFDRLMVWVMDKDDLIQFAGPVFQHPLTKEQLLNYIKDDRHEAYKIVFDRTNEVIGHCELNFEKKMPRLSRILIGDQSYRGMGLGFQILDLMLHEIFSKSDADSADLNVFEWNKAAINSYEKMGFVHMIDRIDDSCTNINGWTAINMVITKATWLKNSKL